MKTNEKEKEVACLAVLAEKMQTEQRGRKLLRKRDAERLLSLSTKAVGAACKAMAAASCIPGYEPHEEVTEFTAETWNAYELLIHLVFEDWEEAEVMEFGKKR